MAKLNIEQRTISSLFSDKKSDFLIPDYQRPYAWGEDECSTLWDDLFQFAFPNESKDNFDSENDDYFLGPIVTFKNSEGKQEIIDGQQRLTTMMLLLRAFYSKFENARDDDTVETRKLIARCIWKTTEMGNPIMDRLKIDSEVASDSDKEEFLAILRIGKVEEGMKSRYAWVFQYFQGKIVDFADKYVMYTALFPVRILNNVILLPIEAESQDTALRIFSTLNDRGLPLSDADIFKSQLYKFFSSKGRKDEFVGRWKDLEEGANDLFRPMRGTPMDELFTRYMYYRRALMGIVDTTTRSLRAFYGEDSYAMLKNELTLDDLEGLLSFWRRVESLDDDFSVRVRRRLFVLSYAPNGMWTYLLSVWFLANRNDEGGLDEDALHEFLGKVIGFVFAYAIERPGVNALRSPVFPEMVNIVQHRSVTFESYLFRSEDIAGRFRSYAFTNQRPVTKSILVWWAFRDPDQGLLDADTKLEIEHIYARRRAQDEPLSRASNMEALGNKAILEKRINIRAADYRFADKKGYYLGDGNRRPGTLNHELRALADTSDDFTEADIEARTEKIIDSFVDYLGEVGLLAD